MVFVRNRRRMKVYYASFQRGDGEWVHERSGTNKRDAKALEAQRKREVQEGNYRGPGPSATVTLRTFGEEWLAKRRNKTRAKDAQRMRDHVFPRLGNRKMNDLKHSECLDFVGELLSSGMSVKTAKNVWGTLRTCLRDAKFANVIAFDAVLPKGIIPKVQPTIHEIYSNDNVQKVAFRSDDDGGALFATIAFYTGMRCGEICGLRWTDWQDDEDENRLGALIVRRQYSGLGEDDRTKTGTVRIVPVHRKLASFRRKNA